MGAPLPLVSTIRQGANPMNGTGLVTSMADTPPWAFAGLQVAGAAQFGIASLPRIQPADNTEINPANTPTDTPRDRRRLFMTVLISRASMRVSCAHRYLPRDRPA